MSATNASLQKLCPDDTALLVCDLQDKSRDHILYFPQIVTVAKRLIDGASILNMQILATEHYPKEITKIAPELEMDSQKIPVIEKTLFSMCVPDLIEQLKPNVKSIIICGIEAHVCVYQSALDFLEKGYRVHVVVDAVSSRTAPDRFFSFKLMEKAGAFLTTSECVLLNLCRDSAHPKFQELLLLIQEPSPDTGLISYV